MLPQHVYTATKLQLLAHMFWDWEFLKIFFQSPVIFVQKNNNTVHTSSFSSSLFFLELMVPAAQPKTIAFASLLA